MTIAATPTALQYQSNGSTTQFAFGNKVFAASDLTVVLIRNSDGAQFAFTNQANTTLGLSYSVLNVDVDGGCIVAFASAPASGYTVDIRSNVPNLQSTSLKNQGPYFPELHEEALDRLTRELQDLRRLVQSSVRCPDVADISPLVAMPVAASRAGRYLAFDGSGQPVASAGTGNDSALRSDLANGTTPGLGFNLVAISRLAAEITAAVTPTAYQYQPSATIKAARYGLAAAASAAVNKAAIAAAMAVAVVLGGGTIECHEGAFNCSDGVTLSPRCYLKGQGQYATILQFSGTADGITCVSPLNTSTPVWNGLRDLTIQNSNGSNAGGGYVDVGGTFVTVRGVQIQGFKHQIIFDQTECGHVSECVFGATISSGSCIWLANGDDHSPGASVGFTNQITVSKCQINGNAGAIGIIDDGGNSHSFLDNNYNGLTNHIRTAGGISILIAGGEWEGAAGANITCFNTSKFGADAVGPTVNLQVASCTFVPSLGQSCIAITNLSQLVADNNYYGNSSAVKITGCSAVANIYSRGAVNGGGGAVYDANATVMNVETLRGSFTATITGHGSNPTVTVNYVVDSDGMCTLGITANASANSNSTAMTMTGLPAACTPLTTQLTGLIAVTDGGVNAAAGCSISGTTVTFLKGLTFDPAGFTNTATTKGVIAGTQIRYPVR